MHIVELIQAVESFEKGFVLVLALCVLGVTVHMSVCTHLIRKDLQALTNAAKAVLKLVAQ